MTNLGVLACRSLCADVPPAWKKHVRNPGVHPNGVDVTGMGIMDFLPVKDLLDREIIVERLVISGRARR